MLEFDMISVGYKDRIVLKDLSMKCMDGSVTTLIGKNGCGKTTLIRALMGMLPTASGNIYIDGADISSLSRSEHAKKVAYLSQSKGIPDITAGRMVLHGRFPYLSYPRRYSKSDMNIALEAMEEMGIADLYDCHMSTLSGGMRQKVYIAMALAQRSPVIVMDEPTTYLDPEQQMKFAVTVKELSEIEKTVLLVLHDLPLAMKISDQIAVLDDGRIAFQGTPNELLEAGISEKMYGLKMQCAQCSAGVQYYYEMDLDT